MVWLGVSPQTPLQEQTSLFGLSDGRNEAQEISEIRASSTQGGGGVFSHVSADSRTPAEILTGASVSWLCLQFALRRMKGGAVGGGGIKAQYNAYTDSFL